MTECKNCGELVIDKYCSHCGQNGNIGKITTSKLLKEIIENTFQINRGFFYTLKELFTNPGKSIQDFLNGKRKNHFKPISYVLVLSTLYFLVSQLAGESTWMDDLITGYAYASTEGEKAPTVLTWFSRNYAYATLLLIPLFSLASYLAFWKRGTNYIEHIVLNSYATGQQAIFYSFLSILKVFSNSEILEILPVLVAISYTFWVFWQFFKEGNRVLNLLRSIITYALYFIFCFGILILTIAIHKV